MVAVSTLTPLAQAIRRLRGNESPDSFATRVGVHWRTVYKLESGQRGPPRAETLIKIAEACGVPAGELLDLLRTPRKRRTA
jgi:transcriptional regulator with XRE-family HTH domain